MGMRKIRLRKEITLPQMLASTWVNAGLFEYADLPADKNPAPPVEVKPEEKSEEKEQPKEEKSAVEKPRKRTPESTSKPSAKGK